MNEREELQRAREELKSSIKVVQKNLKIFGKAVVSSQKAVLRNVGNNIINTYKQLQREERKLKFKQSVKQKANSLKSRIGKVKNSFLKTLTTKNMDLKIREAFDRAGIFSLTVAGTSLAAANKVKNKITDFTSTQIAKLTEYRMIKQEEKKERARQEAIRQTEALEEANRRARNRENTVISENERTLKFKDGVKQKASSLKSKLVKVKNSFLKTLTAKNIDLKLRDAFDKVGIFGLTAAGVGLAVANKGKDKITDLTSTQIAKLTEYRIRKQEEKQKRKGIIEALTAQERTEYDLKHKENTAQKEQLKQALLAQKNRLLNIQNEKLESKPKSR